MLLKGIFGPILRPFDPFVGADRWPRSVVGADWSLGGGRGLNSMVNQPRSRGDRATIVGRSGHDRVMIGPRSNQDREPRSWGIVDRCRPIWSGKVGVRSRDQASPRSSSVRWGSNASEASTRLNGEPKWRRFMTVRSCKIVGIVSHDFLDPLAATVWWRSNAPRSSTRCSPIPESWKIVTVWWSHAHWSMMESRWRSDAPAAPRVTR